MHCILAQKFLEFFGLGVYLQFRTNGTSFRPNPENKIFFADRKSDFFLCKTNTARIVHGVLFDKTNLLLQI